MPERNRKGFTLLELLVAMAIIVTVLGIAVAFLGATGYQKTAGSAGASELTGWLLIARQRALRDGVPRGIRLIPDPTNPTVARDIQYIEQPPDFNGGQYVITAAGNTVYFRNVDLSGGQGNAALWPVQPGDLFQGVDDQTSYLHYITVVNPTPQTIADPKTGQPVVVQSITVTGRPPTPPGNALNAHTSWEGRYRIVRAPRPLEGEAVMRLPRDVGVDLARSLIAPDVLVNASGTVTNIDILFAQTGQLLRANRTVGKVVLWVRDTHLDGFDGDQILVAIYTRTGFIATHPADPGPNNDYVTYPPGSSPYTFTQDGKASGM